MEKTIFNPLLKSGFQKINDNFQLQGDNYRTVLGDKGTALLNGADLLAKLAEVSALTPFGLPLSITNKAVLYVYSGYYTMLSKITIPSYVSIIGICQDKYLTVIQKLADSGDHFIDMDRDYCSIQNLTIKDTSSNSERVISSTSSYPNSSYENLFFDCNKLLLNTTNSGRYIDIDTNTNAPIFSDAIAMGTPLNDGYFKNITCLNGSGITRFKNFTNAYVENINAPTSFIAFGEIVNSTFKNIICQQGFGIPISSVNMSGSFQDILIKGTQESFNLPSNRSFTGTYKNIVSEQGGLFNSGNSSGNFENIIGQNNCFGDGLNTYIHSGIYKNINSLTGNLFERTNTSGIFENIKCLNNCFCTNNTSVSVHSGVYKNISGLIVFRLQNTGSQNSGSFKDIYVSSEGFTCFTNSGIFDNIQGVNCFVDNASISSLLTGIIKNSSFTTSGTIKVTNTFQIFNTKMIGGQFVGVTPQTIRSYNNQFNTLTPYGTNVTNLITESAAGNIKDTNIS